MNTKDEGRVIEVSESFSRKEDRALPAVVEAGQATPMAMLAMAVKQGMSLETIKELRALQKEFEADEARKAYNAAFSAFRAEAIKVIKATTYGSGPLAGKKYAELYSVVNAVTPALSQNGLSASWKLTKDDKDWIEVTCTLRHVLGHSESVSMGGPPDSGGAKSPIQARVSSVTFLERYTLKAICGVSEQGDDKDGNGGGKEKVEPDAEGKAKLEACGSLAALAKAWSELTAEQRKTLNEVKESMKKQIQDADKAAQ